MQVNISELGEKLKIVGIYKKPVPSKSKRFKKHKSLKHRHDKPETMDEEFVKSNKDDDVGIFVENSEEYDEYLAKQREKRKEKNKDEEVKDKKKKKKSKYKKSGCSGQEDDDVTFVERRNRLEDSPVELTGEGGGDGEGLLDLGPLPSSTNMSLPSSSCMTEYDLLDLRLSHPHMFRWHDINTSQILIFSIPRTWDKHEGEGQRWSEKGHISLKTKKGVTVEEEMTNEVVNDSDDDRPESPDWVKISDEVRSREY